MAAKHLRAKSPLHNDDYCATLNEVAKELKISRELVRQTELRVLQRLRLALWVRGIAAKDILPD